MTNIRRSRGYNFEYSLVNRLNNAKWTARRLGGSSTGLPDIVAVNNRSKTLISIEAKSGTSNALYVPPDQLERCFLISKMFRVYPHRHVILAFKFMRKRRVTEKNELIYKNRKLIEYYKIADKLEMEKEYPIIKCNYDGDTFAIRGKNIKSIMLPDYDVPFRFKI